ncbi:defense protein l(2)34Fc-like [Macrosteles quadrilineatus]|uniref:defense protein l(2)34Fc-like n=1 Tax=Macrosteles quadrilineatus TaxID=74068 RepID=UPI0023E24011|nr:defense protein l(2)34Fc-like [Macrosteles quadrilineatus]
MKPTLAPGLLLAAAAVSVVSDVLDLDYSTCITLDPFDSALPQTTPFPYVLNVSKTGVIHNQDSIILTIRTQDPRVEFERFLVQARDTVLGVPVGQFVDTGDADITLYNCFHRPENTATEFNQDPKREARMRWMPDYDYNGTVRLIATVVQTKDIYWLRQLAAELQVYNPW